MSRCGNERIGNIKAVCYKRGALAMNCNKCGYCEADLTALENVAIDTRSRGNYQIATMLDQALERCDVLRENLQANNREYLKNISRMVKKQSSSDVCTNLLRDAKQVVETTKGQQQTTPHRGGFVNMLAASRGVSSTPTPEQTEPELHSSSEFIRMLEESSERTHEETVQRASTPTRRRMGFKNMFEASQRGTLEGDEEPRDRDSQPRLGFLRMLDTSYQRHVENGSVETRIPYGLAASLEAMSPTKPRKPLDERSGVHRGMGFANMLEGARSGTE